MESGPVFAPPDSFEPSLLEAYTLLLAPQGQKGSISNDVRLRMRIAPTVILSRSGRLDQRVVQVR